jgi:hypothetical protein
MTEKQVSSNRGSALRYERTQQQILKIAGFGFGSKLLLNEDCERNKICLMQKF